MTVAEVAMLTGDEKKNVGDALRTFATSTRYIETNREAGTFWLSPNGQTVADQLQRETELIYAELQRIGALRFGPSRGEEP
ncbi:MAG: hypothetical protein AB7O78_02695 [Thermoleophilia bacterium]